MSDESTATASSDELTLDASSITEVERHALALIGSPATGDKLRLALTKLVEAASRVAVELRRQEGAFRLAQAKRVAKGGTS